MALKKFSFNVKKNEEYARLGIIHTHRGSIDTPAFMPVGTQATVKGTFLKDIQKTGSQIILCNTYHLMVRPGVQRIKKETRYFFITHSLSSQTRMKIKSGALIFRDLSPQISSRGSFLRKQPFFEDETKSLRKNIQAPQVI